MIAIGSEVVAEPQTERDADTARPRLLAVPTAELVECSCPEFCERDHDVD